MTIEITIDPSAETEVIQNVALALNLSQVTDDEAGLALAESFKKQVTSLALVGKGIRERKVEAAATDAATKLITVAVK